MIKMTTAWIVIMVLFCSAGIAQERYGLRVIEPSGDSLCCDRQIKRIKNANHARFDSSVFRIHDLCPIRYRLFSPDTTKKEKRYPLVVIFHGSGQIGRDNTSQLGLLPKLFTDSAIQEKFPSFVLAPQFSTRSANYIMDVKRGVLKSISGPPIKNVLLLIDSLCRVYPIDSRRVYAVGYSMGGSTVINCMAQRPELFAAGISIAGIPNLDQLNILKQNPLWLIHGSEDKENDIRSDEEFYEEVNEKVRFWKFMATGHQDIFTMPLLGEAMPAWLFAIKKND